MEPESSINEELITGPARTVPIELSAARVAVVHDWLPLYGGAERVLEQILAVVPHADVFSLIDTIPSEERGFLQNKPVQTSFIQTLPWGKKKYRAFFPLMPLAIEQFDLSSYDIIISSSYSFAKGALTGPDQLHLCYCHSPIRYAWDLQHQYLRAAGLVKGVRAWLARVLLHYIRLWDMRTAAGVDAFMANSAFVARRIYKVYRRESTVIYPPVDTDWFQCRAEKESFYLTASRMVPYKQVQLIVEAFREMPDKELIVIGDGPEFHRIKARATANVQILGYQNAEILRDHLQRARAFIFAAEEDFGIIPLEAQACGTPVIAYEKGGAMETIISGVTGLFFESQTVESIKTAVNRFERHQHQFDPLVIRKNAERFSVARFREEFGNFVSLRWRSFQEMRLPARQ